MIPIISIILPVFNGEKYLHLAIESCIKQTFINIEIIIVNDCSTDNSLNISEIYAEKDKRIKIISNKNNLKLPASLNIGHKASKGNFITWISDDNMYKINALEVLYENITNKGVDLVFSNFTIIDSKNILIRNCNMNSVNSILFQNTIGASFLYNKEVFNRNLGYDECLHTIEDYDFWLRASIHSRFEYVDENIYYYRKHKNSLSAEVKSISEGISPSFIDKVSLSYCKFFKSYQISNYNNLGELFSKFHLGLPFDTITFLVNYINIVKDLAPLKNIIDCDSLKVELDKNIRNCLYNFNDNHNVKTLLFVMWYRPNVIFSYDKRRTLKIICNCFKPKI